jgi:parvulin-like peptidyl-prolyl isomerase
MLTRNWLNNLFCFKSLKKSLAHAGLFYFLLAASFSLSGCDLFSRRIFTRTVLQIQDEKLSLQDFSKLLAKKLKSLDPLSAKDPAIVKKFKDRIISDFIIDSLIQVWFSESKLSLNKTIIDQTILGVTKNYPSDSAFRTSLAEEDLSYDDWARGVQLALKRQLLFKELQKKTDPISDLDIKNFYESNRPRFFQKESVLAKSILISDENQSDVIKKLYKKNSFEKLIAEYSIENPKPKDGIYAWVEIGSSADLDILFTNKKNELIGPVKMNEGLRMFKVTQRKPARQKLLEDVSDQIKNEILSLRESARFSAWLDEQIKRYTVYKNTLAIDAISVETRED